MAQGRPPGSRAEEPALSCGLGCWREAEQGAERSPKAVSKRQRLLGAWLAFELLP